MRCTKHHSFPCSEATSTDEAIDLTTPPRQWGEAMQPTSTEVMRSSTRNVLPHSRETVGGGTFTMGSHRRFSCARPPIAQSPER